MQKNKRSIKEFGAFAGFINVFFGKEIRDKQGGFTLIEVLVVVLIIGILTAVALPNYQVAVLKSRASELVLLVNEIKQAQEIYYTTYNKYAYTLENLDVTIDATAQNTSGSPRIYNTPTGKVIWLWSSGIAEVGLPGQIAFTRYYANTTYDRENLMFCKAATASADKVCKSLGGALWHSNTSCDSAGGSGCRLYAINL